MPENKQTPQPLAIFALTAIAGLLVSGWVVLRSVEDATAAAPAARYIPLAGNVDRVGDGLPIDLGRNRIYNVRSYGALGNGIADDTAEVQLAIDAAEVAGGVVYFQSGTYKITATLTANAHGVMLCGAGTSSVLAWGFNGNLISATPPASDGLNGFCVRDLWIQPTASRSSGLAVYAQRTFRALIHNVRVGEEYHSTDPAPAATAYDGFYLDEQAQCEVSGCYLYVKRHGLKVSGAAAGRWHYDGFVRGCEFWGVAGNDGVGVHVGGGTGGLRISDTNAVLFDRGILIDKTLVNVTNREVVIGPGTFLDSCGVWGLDIAANSLQRFQWDGVWAASCGTRLTTTGGAIPNDGYPSGGGANIAAQGDDFQAAFTGGTFLRNRGTGLTTAARNVSVVGIHFHNNGLGTNGGHGVYGSGGTSHNLLVQASRIQLNGNATVGYGIKVDASAVGLTAIGNNLYGANGQGDTSLP